MKLSVLLIIAAIVLLASCGKDERPTRTAIPVERPHVQFTCKGNDKAWTMDVGDTSAVFQLNEHTEAYSVRNVFPVSDGYIVFFNGETTLTLHKEACSDSAGTKWGYSAILANPVDTVHGCANIK